MKRNRFIVLSLMVVFGAGIYWIQQGPTEPTQHELDKPVHSSTAAEKQMREPVLTKIAESESNSKTDKQSDEAAPMTREEMIKASRLYALKKSGLDKRIEKKKHFVETRLEQIKLAQQMKAGHNESVNKRLNIDVKEKFGLDLDTRMAAVQAERQQKDSAELENKLRAWGVEPEQLEEITAMRDLVLDIGNNSK